MIGKDILRIVLYGIGLGSVSSLVYFAGPLIAIGEWHPLENYIVRDIVLVVLIAGVAGFGGFKFYRRRKGSQQIADGISAEAQEVNDEPVLKERMKDALATLKTASGSKSGYLYDLPWYVIIGPPGAGKTTALVNSGLKFPLSRGATPAAIAGVGGTRYCDWWFTEEAVLIDTAGRYTTQDSDAKSRQGKLVFIPRSAEEKPAAAADQRRPRRDQHRGYSHPVRPRKLAAHAECDPHAAARSASAAESQLPGLCACSPRPIWSPASPSISAISTRPAAVRSGARRFRPPTRTRIWSATVPNEFDLLLERLSEETLDRLQDEPAPQHRVQLFGLPAQMARLKHQIFDFLNQIFEPTRYHVNANLRGFYFTSGTQQGTPIDQLIGSLARTFRRRGSRRLRPIQAPARVSFLPI